MTYTELLEIKEISIDGESNWHWIKGDSGAWDGPKQDWETSHKDKFFKYLKDRRVVVTAGGNQGMYTRLYSKLFETVYSFEPDPLNFHCLVLNNQADNVIKIQGALGAMNGFISVQRYNMNNTGMHQVQSGGKIPMFELDSFRFEHIDLLQLDVEGYEHNVLLGALDTIERCKPVIAAERGNRPEINELLAPYGYKPLDQSVSDTIFVPE